MATNIAFIRSPITCRLFGLLIIATLAGLACYILLHPPKVNIFNRVKVLERKFCHLMHKHKKNVRFFEDISIGREQPDADSIFFHETSCGIDGLAHLHMRQACAIESAAKWNPNRKVFVTFSSPVGFESDKQLSPMMNALATYENIHLRNLDMKKYAEGTPAAEWFNSDELYLSEHLEVHTSDFLQFVTAFKHGGTVINLDMISQSGFDGNVPNFAGAQSQYVIDDALLHFDTSPVGRNISSECFNEFTQSFNPKNMNANGPSLITRVMQKICGTMDVLNMKPEMCRGFIVYAPPMFYPVPSNAWQQLFEPAYADQTIELVANSVTVRLWNRLSANFTVKKGATPTAYSLITAKNCPKVYLSSGEFF